MSVATITYKRCVTCHEPVTNYATCYKCGRAVHWNEPQCGGWILDSWHPMANDPDDGNEFWCMDCLNEKDPATLQDGAEVVVKIAEPFPISDDDLGPLDDHPF